jgi:hypothetical protein
VRDVLRASLAAALLSLAVVPLAAPIAQADDGVTVDRNSPSAKEYAIPLDEARSDATGGASRSGAGGGPVPFGEGVTTPERSSSPSSGPARKKSTKKDRTSTTARTTTEPSSDEDADPTRTVAASPVGGGDSGSSSGQALAGGAALVILAGGAAGLWARRRQPAGDPGYTD